MGQACAGNKEDGKLDIATGKKGLVFDGRAQDYVTNVPARVVRRLVKFSNMMENFPEGALAGYELKGGDSPNSVRIINFDGSYIAEETCTFSSDNGHGWCI